MPFGLEGIIPLDVISAADFEFRVNGLELIVLERSGLEQEIDQIELPDGRIVSGQKVKAQEMTIMVAAHMTREVTFFDQWMEQARGPRVPRTAYRTVTIVGKSNTKTRRNREILRQCWVCKRSNPDLNLDTGSTEMTKIEYTLKVNSQTNVPI